MIENAAALLAQRAAAQAADPNLPPERVAQLMTAIAELQRALQPRYLNAMDVSAKTSLSTPHVFIDNLSGFVQLVVHDGKVLPKSNWTWDSIHKHLHLINLSGLDPSKVTEVYYLAE